MRVYSPSLRHCHALAALLVMILMTVNHAQAQGYQLPTLEGSTRSVVVPQFSTVDAGPIVFRIDSDHDGMADDQEIAAGLNPNDPADADGDLDGDGLTNGDELSLGTDPRMADTDGDGFSDAQEVLQGYDPRDPDNHPPIGVALSRIEVTPSLMSLTINSLLGARPSQLKVTGFLTDGSTVDLTNSPTTTYASSDAATVGVDDFGRVIGLQVGTAAIVARNAGYSGQAIVAVSLFRPTTNGSVVLPGFANEVDVRGDFVFVACGAAGLQVVDVGSPRSPAIVGSTALPGNAVDVQVVESRAYLACGTGGLGVVDVSDPANPQLIAGVPLVGEAISVRVEGQFAYVACSTGGLSIVDVTSTGEPIVVATLPVGPAGSVVGVGVDPARRLVVLGVRDTGDSVVIVDVTDVADPRLRSTVPIAPAEFRLADTFVMGTNAFAATGDGLVVVDISDADAPTIRGTGSPVAVGSGVELNNGFGVMPIWNAAASAFAFVTEPASGSVAYVGAFGTLFDDRSIYRYPTGQALDSSRVYLCASSLEPNGPGFSGNTALFIVQYDSQDTYGIPPAVTIQNPREGEGLVAGESPVSIRVRATDDIGVAGVEIKANGETLASLTEPPFVAMLTVPSIPGSVTVTARAIDVAGNIAAATTVVPVLASDPLTTVSGRVVTPDGSPVPGALVVLDGGQGLTTTADSTGGFGLPGVVTVPLGSLASVTATDPSGEARGQSIARPIVRDGLTDLGLVVLVKGATSLLPTAPSAFGVLGFANTVSPDLFIGFSDRQSLVYSPDGQGGYAPSASFALPFVAARAGVATLVDGDFNFDVLAQAVGQNGAASTVRGDGQGGVLGSSSVATGLAGESEMVAAGYEPNGFPNRTVAAFAAADGLGSTAISVRIRDGAGQFVPLATLSVSGSVRTLAVEDVTGDGLMDVVASRQVSGSEGRLVVFPRTGVADFGPAIESTILIRSASVNVAAVDFILGDVYSNTNGSFVDLLVLGDDRVRVYTTDGTGVFVAEDEIALPADVVPSGLGAHRFSGGVAYVVVGRRTGTSEGRALFVYTDVRGEAVRYEYDSPASEGDARVVLGEFGDPGLADVLVVDGDRITTFLGVGPYNGVDKASPRSSARPNLAGKTSRQ